jgi:hypothetical protein
MISAVSQCNDRLICEASAGYFSLALLHAAHDELEVRVVVALLRPDHQEVALRVRTAVQAVRAVEHEDLERGHAMLARELRDLAHVGRVHRREVVAVIDVEAPAESLSTSGKNLRYGPPLFR